RGERAWRNCRRALQARGEVLDWREYIPPQIPAEQNVFKAPKTMEWFVGRNTNELVELLGSRHLYDSFRRGDANTRPVQVAEITVVGSSTNLNLQQVDSLLHYWHGTAVYTRLHVTNAVSLSDPILNANSKAANGLTSFGTKLPESSPTNVIP